MPSKYDYQEFIQDELNYLSKIYPGEPQKALAYQLGFLQGFLIKIMMERREIAGEFKDQVRSTLKRQGRSVPTTPKTSK